MYATSKVTNGSAMGNARPGTNKKNLRLQHAQFINDVTKQRKTTHGIYDTLANCYLTSKPPRGPCADIGFDQRHAVARSQMNGSVLTSECQ